MQGVKGTNSAREEMEKSAHYSTEYQLKIPKNDPNYRRKLRNLNNQWDNLYTKIVALENEYIGPVGLTGFPTYQDEGVRSAIAELKRAMTAIEGIYGARQEEMLYDALECLSKGDFTSVQAQRLLEIYARMPKLMR